jgi:hypothetical protein
VLVTVGKVLETAHPIFKEIPVSVQRTLIHKEVTPHVTFVVPIHNQEDQIRKNLDSIVKCAVRPHEFSIILDDCSDESAAQVAMWLSEIVEQESGLTSSVTLATTGQSVFETTSDALGIEFGTADFIIEIQADMLIQHAGFDHLMLTVLESNPDVFAVSGRGIHPLAIVRRPDNPTGRVVSKLLNGVAKIFRSLEAKMSTSSRSSSLLFRLTGQAGRLGESMSRPVHVSKDVVAYVGGSVIRGPLAMARRDYSWMGGFDLQHFFLGNDDHDLMVRAQQETGRTGAFVPVQFSSPLGVGSTRKVKPPAAQQHFAEVKKVFARDAMASALFNPEYRPRFKVRRRVRPVIALPIPAQLDQTFGVTDV